MYCGRCYEHMQRRKYRKQFLESAEDTLAKLTTIVGHFKDSYQTRPEDADWEMSKDEIKGSVCSDREVWDVLMEMKQKMIEYEDLF